ncbi:hypothetical protein DH2020_025851 [Rehmannia glutinosa]|uniref:Uncharacterized protein n=1 Tax=Rehmannia glutinosa TaxID=99300 RepID=A0ABR0W0F2_REHGL
MSLVDYAASSDEDEPQTPADEEENEQVKKENPEKRPRFEVPAPGPSSAAPPNDNPVHSRNRIIIECLSERLEDTIIPAFDKWMGPPSRKQAEMVSAQSSELKLPDASFLLNSTAVPSNLLNSSDHSSRVTAAMAESAARKRELNGSAASFPRNKVPKGTLPHSKGVPDTVGGRLVPPQLAGRSNVVTEDISKLFVRKPTNSSTE